MTKGFDEIKLEEIEMTKIITLVFKEKLSKDDYQLFIPQLERIIQSGYRNRILIELHDFQGWTTGALWEDTKFGVKHFRDIERLAVVGDKKWEKLLAMVIKPFTAASVRFFEFDDIDTARSWIKADCQQ